MWNKICLPVQLTSDHYPVSVVSFLSFHLSFCELDFCFWSFFFIVTSYYLCTLCIFSLFWTYKMILSCYIVGDKHAKSWNIDTMLVNEEKYLILSVCMKREASYTKRYSKFRQSIDKKKRKNRRQTVYTMQHSSID